VHIAIVDPGVGTEREIIVAAKDGHLFMAPDNGLLEPILESAERICKLRHGGLSAYGVDTPSLTFHGRDIFAPLAAELAAGRIAIDDIATDTAEWTPGWLDEPQVQENKVSGIVVTVDAFGNLISNIDASMIEDFKHPVVEVAGINIEMKPTYGRASPGDYLALINSFKVVEIARAEDSAANGLGCDRGAPVSVTDLHLTK